MSAWTLNLLLVVFLCLASFPLKTKQQDDSNDNNDYTPCSFISGEGCMNGVCKFCALCLPTYCILATPYYTGDSNQGSICEATSQEYGYDFYNYCLLSTQDDGIS